MLLTLKDIIILYERIQQDMNISELSIVIFASVDADSLCTLKILTKLFRGQSIHYKVYPVNSYQELQVKIQDCRQYQNVKLFFFINCGGIIDLSSLWIGSSQTAKIILFDVNKPIHHKNIEHDFIYIINDEESNLQNCPTTEDINKYEELNQYDLDEESAVSSEDEKQQADSSPKRKSTKKFKDQLRKHKLIIRNKIDSYYGKQFFSLPSSYSAYRMVRDLNKSNNQFLWYAIVGFTGMFMEQKTSKEQFDSLFHYYKSQVSKYNIQNLKKEKGEVSVRMDYQFTLLNHWSLYESMINSNYLMVKLMLWEDKGIKKLHEILTHIGISLQEARQEYKFMSAASQNKLEEKIYGTAQKYGLLDIAFHSFSRQVDSYSSFMASDFHYILAAILERPSALKLSHEAISEMRLLNFWEAFGIFDQNVEYLTERIKDYTKVASQISKVAKSLIERDQIIPMQECNYVNIRNQSMENKLFEHPVTLMKLSYLLMGIMKEKKKSRNYKAFVASLQNADQCLIVGVVIDSKNEMGKKFNEVAETLSINVKQDGFQSNIMIIPKEALYAFVKTIGTNDKLSSKT